MAAAVKVEKATSELLVGPDWTLNIDICDAVNSDHGQAKEVIKALKKRLQHKRSKVQFFALTLLETLVKNCGDHVHFLVVERDILPEMIKVAKKKADTQVRDKILTLLDSWQEAFGGPGGKHPQFYWAYSEMKQSGFQFPRRSPDATTIIPPHLQPGYGMPLNSSLKLDETMSSSGPSLSLSDLGHMLSAVDLLSEMMGAINPNDHEAVNDEIITELVNQCRSYQNKITSLVSSVRDEEVLCQTLDLNDRLQILLSKHDTIASGSPLPAEETDVSSELPGGTTTTHAEIVGPQAAAASTAVPTNVLDDEEEEEEEEEDDEFSQLARRNSRIRSANAESTSSGVSASLSSTRDGITSSTTSVTSAAAPSISNPGPLAPVRTSPEDQIMSDLLALTISSNPSPPHTSVTPEAFFYEGSPPTSDHQQHYHTNPDHTVAAHNSYVAPWAQQQQSPPQSQFPDKSSPYPPPPWASQESTGPNPFVAASSGHCSISNSPVNVPSNLRPIQQSPSFGMPLRNAGPDSPMNQSLKQPMSAGARRPSYVTSNRLFDDLFEKKADDSPKMSSKVGGGTSSPYK